MRAEKTDRKKFAENKPVDCAFCYFWNKKKGACTQPECYYLITAGPDTESENSGGSCSGCPYGRHSPCIGYCLLMIIREMKLRI